jgi:hypothetical protein
MRHVPRTTDPVQSLVSGYSEAEITSRLTTIDMHGTLCTDHRTSLELASVTGLVLPTALRSNSKAGIHQVGTAHLKVDCQTLMK